MEQSQLTIFPNRQVSQTILLDQRREDSARVNIEELDIALRVIVRKVIDNLVRRCFGAAVANRSRLVHLRRKRRDMNDGLWTTGSSGRQSQELLNQMVKPDDVDSVHVVDLVRRDIFGRFEVGASGACGASDEDVNLADKFEDLAHARVVGLRGGVSRDLGLGGGFLERLFCSGEHGFPALDDDDACDAGFRKGFADLVAYASGCSSVSGEGQGISTEVESLPPAVMKSVLPLASNLVCFGEMRS
jgi:hypothetical protein